MLNVIRRQGKITIKISIITHLQYYNPWYSAPDTVALLMLESFLQSSNKDLPYKIPEKEFKKNSPNSYQLSLQREEFKAIYKTL